MRSIVPSLLLILMLACMPGAAHAAVPLEDDGFTPATPLPDADLIVVREKAYGAGGVDLTAYGIGAGPVTFVQSIYFRFFVDKVLSSIDSFTGRVTFTPGVQILGIITGGSDLGGASDDGAATETDLIFGVAANPNDYSEDFRGFECCGGNGSSEFVCQTSPTSFVYGLNIGNGVDDFRVIIAYTDSFTAGQSFDINSFDIPVLGGAAPSKGMRVGNDTAPTVLGSGDHGEVDGLLNIPLTSNAAPTPGAATNLDPYRSVFILRNTSGSTFLDGFELDELLPAPDLYTLPSGVIGNPVGVTDGPDSLLYAIGRGGGFTAVDAVAETVVTAVLVADLPGNNVDVTNVPGSSELYFVRDGADTFIDHFDPITLTHLDVDTIPSATIANPVSIADGSNGILYVLGNSGELVQLDPSTGSQVDLTPVSIPAGTYVSMTGVPAANELYLLRTDGTAHIDRYDIDLDILTPDVATIASMTGAISITDVEGDRLVAVGGGSSGPALLVEFDRTSMSVLNQSACMDFSGSNVSITNIGNSAGTVSIQGPRRVAGMELAHLAYPNPFTSGTTIRYRLPQPARVDLSLYDLGGRRIARLKNTIEQAGYHQVHWNGRNEAGRRMQPGVYLYRLSVPGGAATGRLTLVD